MNSGTWTRMKQEGLVRFEWGDMLKTHVTCITLVSNPMTLSVKELERRLQDGTALRPILEIYEDMLAWAKSNG